MWAVLLRRNFAVLLFSGLISGIGDGALFVALPIYIYQVTHSPLATSGMFLAELVPSLLLGSVAGVFVDRWNRKKTMVIANLVLTLGLLPLLAVHSAGVIWIVYVVAFVQSAVSQFLNPAEAAFLPRVVGEEHLIAANSLFSFSNSLVRLTGPSLGGLVAVLAGLSGVTLLDSVSFLVAAIAIALIGIDGRAERVTVGAAIDAPRAWEALWREWFQGLRLVQQDRRLTLILGAFSVASLGEGVFGVMFVIWVNKVLGGGPEQLGWFMSAQGIGGLAGGAVIGQINRRISPLRLAGWGSVLFGLIDMALFLYPVFILAIAPGIALIILVGVPAGASSAALLSMLQATVHDEFRGRIFGMLGTTSALFRLAGTLLAGALGGIIGPIVLLTVMQGGSYVLVGLTILAVFPRFQPQRTGAISNSR